MEAKLDAKVMIEIHGKEKALKIAKERRYDTESDSTAMYWDQVYQQIQKLKTE